ncbi:MAG: hypothetical protein LJE68_11245 [Rhodobacter sp.]|nr:hypothetical protein [Rhodobacter sp.]
MSVKKCLAIAFAACLIGNGANAFELDFSWQGLKSCTNGYPNRVSNPVFHLGDVPPGTKYIRFKLVDLDVPNYKHGGGVVAYSGQSTIAAGAFKYKSPCPPGGSHRYEWRATAQKKKNGGIIATAKKVRTYP